MKMTRLFFRVLAVVILSVNCPSTGILENFNVGETLHEIGFDEPWDKLSPLDQKKAFRILAERCNRVELNIIQVVVVDYMRFIFESFIDGLVWSSRDTVIQLSIQVKDPPEADIPADLVNARYQAKTDFERNRAKTRIEAFNFAYRRMLAILEVVKESDNDEVAVFKKSLREYGVSSYEAAALAGSKLYSDLSNLDVNNQHLVREIDWNGKEDAIIASLKFWGIKEPDVISVARALHDFGTIQMKKIQMSRIKMMREFL